MSVTTRDQGKAQEIARKIMSGWDVGDLENLMTEMIPQKDRLQLRHEIEPKYDAMEKEAMKIHDGLLKRLQKPEDRAALGRYSEIELELNTAEGQAGFHLGFAAALELLGVEGRGSPVRKHGAKP